MSNLHILFSDIHFGRHNDSEVSNQDNLDFLDFLCDYAKTTHITNLSMLGDYHDRRGTLGVSTENYSLRGAQKLIDCFGSENLKFICGNHDLMLRDSNAVTSLAMFEHKIALVKDEPYFDKHNKIMYFPWILNDEHYKELVSRSKQWGALYAFGHFQMNSFMMNNAYPMEGGQDPAELLHLKHVFSGHYHARQTKQNLTYLGSPMPFNYGDSNDTQRGFCVFDPDTGEYEFINYGEIQILSMNYKDFLKKEFTITSPKTSLRVMVDDVITSDTTQLIQNKLESLPLRNSQVNYEKTAIGEILDADNTVVGDIKDLDGLVSDYLSNMVKVEGVDSDLMKSLYAEAVQMSEST